MERLRKRSVSVPACEFRCVLMPETSRCEAPLPLAGGDAYATRALSPELLLNKPFAQPF